MKIITGVELAYDPKYLKKREYQLGKSYGIDELIGFNPNCTLEALAINPEEAVEKAKLKQVERISDDKEIQIVDGVQYQIEGQILKVNIFDPKMKPLTRHMGSLWTKCGSGLIDQLGWLSFVSIDSNSKNQQCHYDYYKSSNDNEAFELFKAVLSGTDSVLDYLQK